MKKGEEPLIKAEDSQPRDNCLSIQKKKRKKKRQNIKNVLEPTITIFQ